MINRAKLREMGYLLNMPEEERVAKRATEIMLADWPGHDFELPEIKPFMVRFVVRAIEEEIGQLTIKEG